MIYFSNLLILFFIIFTNPWRSSLSIPKMNTNKATLNAPIMHIEKDMTMLLGKYKCKIAGTTKEKQHTVPHLSNKFLIKGIICMDIECDTNIIRNDCSKITITRYTYMA